MNKIEERLDSGYSFLFKILVNEGLDTELFGITMTLFHYYTYFKSFKNYDIFKLIIGCLFLAGKIRGMFFKLSLLQTYHNRYTPNSKKIEDKEIITFELDLLINLGFEVEIETPYYYLDKLLKKVPFSNIVMQHKNESNLNNNSHINSNDSERDNKENSKFNMHSLSTTKDHKNHDGNTENLLNNNHHINNNNNNTTPKLSNRENKELVGNVTGHRVTKIIDSSNQSKLSLSSSLVLGLGKEYFNSLSVEELSDKIKTLSFQFLIDSYRRPYCIVFKAKCIAICSFLIAYNLVLERNNSDKFEDYRFFYTIHFGNNIDENEYKDFLLCYYEMLKLFN